MPIDPHIALIGLVVGTLVGLTGIGGGSILAPLLVLVLGIKPSLATACEARDPKGHYRRAPRQREPVARKGA